MESLRDNLPVYAVNYAVKHTPNGGNHGTGKAR